MKRRIVLILLISFILIKTNAQLTKGNWLVGGTGSYDFEKISSISVIRKTQQITISPNIGYFLIDNFGVGLKPQFVLIKREYPGASYFPAEKIYHLSIGPFVRYYFLPTDKVINLLVHSDFSIGVYKYYPENQAVQKESYNSWSMGFGPAIFFNSSVALETIAGYKQVNSNISDQKNQSFQFLIGLQIHLQKLE
jgi:hypothetical protein